MLRNVLKNMGLAAALMVAGNASADGLLNHGFRPLAGKDPVQLDKTYAGKVLLVVNVASKCGNTPQYEGLEAMQQKYAAQGFDVLGFPSNDFHDQEPGSEQEIQQFCTLTYGVKFPMFEKVDVIGDNATPLFKELTAATGEAPDWNFHKYLIGRDGKVVAAFPAKTQPNDPKLVAAIERELGRK